MAYYSLPRLERINDSMYWESGIFHKNEAWLGPKIFITFQFLLKRLLNEHTPFFFYNWQNFYNTKKVCSINQTSANFKPFVNPTAFIYPITYYIYMYNQNYTILTLYKKTLNQNYKRL